MFKFDKKNKMDTPTQFDYILKVLRSSQNEGQVETSTRMFENFKKVWIDRLECPDMLNYIYIFYKEKTKTISNIIRG